MTVAIDPDGTIRCVYSDDLVELIDEGEASIERASHVEPAAEGGWSADLGPIGGPVLGPYALRASALSAEVGWIEERLAGAA